jgi:hypothetical protein
MDSRDASVFTDHLRAIAGRFALTLGRNVDLLLPIQHSRSIGFLVSETYRVPGSHNLHPWQAGRAVGVAIVKDIDLENVTAYKNRARTPLLSSR